MWTGCDDGFFSFTAHNSAARTNTISADHPPLFLSLITYTTTQVPFAMETPNTKATSSFGEILPNATSETANTSPTASSEDSLVHDNPDYVAPEKQDILLPDVTSARLHGRIGTILRKVYLSEEIISDDLKPEKALRGVLFPPNNRFMVNLVCRRDSQRNSPSNSKGSTSWHNVFFLVDTGSPNSFLCTEAMEALIGNRSCTSNIPPAMMRIELFASRDVVTCNLPGADTHCTDVNILGSDVVGNFADISTNSKRKEFTLALH
jgi:hypothetical protein